MKYSEILNLTTEDINQNIIQGKVTLQKLVFSHKISPLENTAQLGSAKKNIARFKTALSVKNNK